LNHVPLNGISPPQVTGTFYGGESFRWTTFTKANRPNAMVSTHRKIADKNVLGSVRLKCPKVFVDVKYGVGCPFGLE